MDDVLELQFKSFKKRDTNQIPWQRHRHNKYQNKNTRGEQKEEKIFEQNLFRKLGHTPTSDQPWDDQVSPDQSQCLRLGL